MSNTSELESISSVCTTPMELIKSEDFMRWIGIILKKVNKFDKEYISSLFTKLQNGETLADNEKWDLTSFVQDEKVAEQWQKLLSRLSDSPNKAETKNQKDTFAFANFLEEMFAEDWYKKVEQCIWEVAEITELSLNRYEWFRKVSIKVKWDEREVYLEETTLKVDSSSWEEKTINWTKVKVNPEWDVTEYLEWEFVWEQLFTWDSAMREAEKQWKRLPFADDENPEFQAIIEEVWIEEFMKLFPGYRYRCSSAFWSRGNDTFYWSASTFGGDHAYGMEFYKWDSKAYRYWNTKDYGLSVRCLKD